MTIRRQREGCRTTTLTTKSRDWQRCRGDWRWAPYSFLPRTVCFSDIEGFSPLLNCIFNIYILMIQLIHQSFLENIVLDLTDEAKTPSIAVAHPGPPRPRGTCARATVYLFHICIFAARGHILIPLFSPLHKVSHCTCHQLVLLSECSSLLLDAAS